MKYILVLLLTVTTLLSCREADSDIYKGPVIATIYYYDSLQKDTVFIETILYKYVQDKEIDGAIVPYTSLVGETVRIRYYVGNLQYNNTREKIYSSYSASSEDHVSIGESPINTSIIIGKNESSVLSVFYYAPKQ